MDVNTSLAVATKNHSSQPTYAPSLRQFLFGSRAALQNFLFLPFNVLLPNARASSASDGLIKSANEFDLLLLHHLQIRRNRS